MALDDNYRLNKNSRPTGAREVSRGSTHIYIQENANPGYISVDR